MIHAGFTYFSFSVMYTALKSKEIKKRIGKFLYMYKLLSLCVPYNYYYTCYVPCWPHIHNTLYLHGEKATYNKRNISIVAHHMHANIYTDCP